MQIIYRAFDGKEFNNKEDCCRHESNSMDGIVMLDVRGNVVQETRSGYLVWLRDESANLAFHALARLQGDNDVDSICEGEDYGLFYWDEGLEEYRWIDTDMVDGLIKIKGIIEGRGDKFNV